MNIRGILRNLHTQIDVWYAYLVATSVTLQETWSQFDDYVPKRARHVVLGVVTGIVLFEKIRKSMAAPK